MGQINNILKNIFLTFIYDFKFIDVRSLMKHPDADLSDAGLFFIGPMLPLFFSSQFWGQLSDVVTNEH